MKKEDLIYEIKRTHNMSDFFRLKPEILKALEGPKKKVKKKVD